MPIICNSPPGKRPKKASDQGFRGPPGGKRVAGWWQVCYLEDMPTTAITVIANRTKPVSPADIEVVATEIYEVPITALHARLTEPLALVVSR